MLPHGGGLLGQQSKKRTYFDSGDFAVSSADRVTDMEMLRLAPPILNDKVFRSHMPLFLTLETSIKMPIKTFVPKAVRKKQLRVHFVCNQIPMNAAEL
ncbi:hypothetical protein P170DRAFT_436731 [Aspergillus steynii IBT 23096]|uniref:Uncharacterized protein n=1 Tax=Aspergillus steynii IBT 23096 TaxID=1392250 RepID=A0A2I2G864_9EURO|nr:uncharacterized protein P170DRAFT_436731 [Aspergillus steynii IBT 23096]PLB49077.1 hypothetical protein P170DRAFT_436731 [Aspergillus steynii IBT 23096]